MKVGSLEDAHKPAKKAGLAHSSLAKPQRKAVLASRRRNGRGTFIVKKRNLPVPENYVAEICARSFEEAAQYTIDLFGLTEKTENIVKEWNNMAVYEYAHNVRLRPYALDYLLRLKAAGIKLAVATGLPEKLYLPCRKINSRLEIFDDFCSTDDVLRG